MKERKKIAIISEDVSKNFYPTGVGFYSINLIKHLLKTNVSPKIYFIQNKKYYPNFLPNDKMIIFPKKKLWKFKKILQEKNIKIVHLLAPTIYNLLLLNFIRSSEIKKIITIHDLYSFLYPTKLIFSPLYLKNLIISKTRCFLLKLISKKIDFFITISENTKNDLIKFLDISPDRIQTTYLAPVNSAQIIPKPIKIQPPFIITHHFDLPLLSIFAEVKKNGFPHKLIIFGSLPKKIKEQTRQKAKKLNIKDDVVLSGYLENEQIAWLYKNAALFIRYVGYEGFGIPALEAMSFGCPVIAARVGSLPEIIDDAGILVDLNKKEKWIKWIEKILGDTDFKNNLIRKGLIRAGQFSWMKTAKITKQIYQKLLN